MLAQNRAIYTVYDDIMHGMTSEQCLASYNPLPGSARPKALAPLVIHVVSTPTLLGILQLDCSLARSPLCFAIRPLRQSRCRMCSASLGN